MTVKEIKKILEENLSPKRYAHILGVVETSKELARRYKYSVRKAELAALLHDVAKEYTKHDRLVFCKLNNVNINDVLKFDKIVHSFLGAEVARYNFGVKDEEVLNAIKYHTTGRANMTKLEKIIYCADFIEPNRRGEQHQERLDEAIKIVNKDLDMGTAYIISETLRFIPKEELYKNTKEAYEFYKKYL